jgi:hypothetical protein
MIVRQPSRFIVAAAISILLVSLAVIGCSAPGIQSEQVTPVMLIATEPLPATAVPPISPTAEPVATASSVPILTPAPTATPEPTPVTTRTPSEAVVFPDDTWIAPEFMFLGDPDAAPPFRIIAPSESTMNARIQYENIIGTLNIGSTEIKFDKGPFSGWNASPENGVEYWREEVNGSNFMFWIAEDFSTSSLTTPIINIVGAIHGRLNFRAEYRSQAELDLILAVFRTIR